jgi:transcriptional regulator with XRE-family HTH domain
MHIGQSLMFFRKLKNKTQQHLAEKLNTTQQYISELEQLEHINGEKLDNILKALNSNREEFEKFKKTFSTHINES